MSASKVERCVTCGKELATGVAAQQRSFCCDRCQMADLGRWLQGDYVITRALTADELEETDPGAGSDLRS